jgi:hypothetical protein
VPENMGSEVKMDEINYLRMCLHVSRKNIKRNETLLDEVDVT